MLLTTKVHIDSNNKDGLDLYVLNRLCYHSARLYNVGLYSVRQHYFNTQKYLPYNKNYHECKNNENYKTLLTDGSIQILRIVDRDMQSFFKMFELKKSGKYSDEVKLPRYKNKDGVMVLPIYGRSCKIQKNGTIRICLTKEFRKLYNIDYERLVITIPDNIRCVPYFNEMRIVPLFGGKEFNIEFTYDTKYLDIKQVSENAEGYLSIDTGVSNLLTCTFHSNSKPAQSFIIDGRYIKNVNYYYNKKASELQSAYTKNKSIEKTNTKRFRRLSNGRNNRINDYLNRAVKIISDFCLSNNIKNIVIGYNKDLNRNIDFGKVNNQNIAYIPLHNLYFKLRAKCELHGINYIPIQESFTSKASAIDLDFIPKYGEGNNYVFSGKRIKRGLYQTKDHLLLNADVNGSINILRKHLQECKLNDLSSDNVRVFANTPVRRLNFYKAHKTSA